MKRWTPLSAIVGIGLVAAYLSAQAPPEFTVEKLADNLVVIKDTNDGKSAGLIVEVPKNPSIHGGSGAGGVEAGSERALRTCRAH